MYKKPELLFECNLNLKEISNNIWRVYFQIASDIVLLENKNVLDEITVGLYLEKHSKLKAKYDEYYGYKTIVNAGAYVKVENFDGYVQELKKWNAVVKLAKRGFP
ncbi:MAG: helicase, partial [Bacilli bacterium]